MQRLFGRINTPVGRVVVLLGAMVLLTVIQWPYLLRMPVPDESTHLYEAWRTVQGDLPYRDFFQFTGPMSFYLTALPIALFGFSLLALRVWALAWLLGCMGLTLLLARRYLSPVWLLVLVWWFIVQFLPSGVEINHHLFSTLFGLTAVYALVRFTEAPGTLKQRARWVWAAGVLIGLACTTTQSLGLFLFVALGLFVGLYPWMHLKERGPIAVKFFLAEFFFPFLWPLLFWVVFFVEQDGLNDYLYSTVGWLLEGHYGQTSSHWYFLDGYTRLSGMIQALLRNFQVQHADFMLDMLVLLIMLVLKGFLPVLGLLWGGEVLLRRLRDGAGSLKENLRTWPIAIWRLTLLWLAAAGFMLATFSYPSSYLIAIHGFIPGLLAFMGVAGLVRHHPLQQRRVLAFLLILFAVVSLRDLQTSLAQYRRTGILSFGTQEKVLSPVGYTEDQVRMLNQMVTLLHQQSPPGKNLFVYNSAPELYILTGRQNPTRYQMLMKLLHSNAQIAEAVADLKREQPVFIVYDRIDAQNFRRDLRFLKVRNTDYRLYPLEALLTAEYQLLAEAGSMRIFIKKAAN